MPRAKKKTVSFSEVEEASSVSSIVRDEHGLISEPKVEYVFSEDGFVNWRKMVKPEYLVANRQKTQAADVTQLEDKDLLILLGGLKDLAQIRGYSSVEYSIKTPSPD